jgi:hypothetical protein
VRQIRETISEAVSSIFLGRVEEQPFTAPDMAPGSLCWYMYAAAAPDMALARPWHTQGDPPGGGYPRKFVEKFKTSKIDKHRKHCNASGRGAQRRAPPKVGLLLALCFSFFLSILKFHIFQ